MERNFKCCKQRFYYFCKGCSGVFHPSCYGRRKNTAVLENNVICCSIECYNRVRHNNVINWMDKMETNFKCCKSCSYYFCKGCSGFFHPSCFGRRQNTIILERHIICCSKECQDRVINNRKTENIKLYEQSKELKEFSEAEGYVRKININMEERNFNEILNNANESFRLQTVKYVQQIKKLETDLDDLQAEMKKVLSRNAFIILDNVVLKKEAQELKTKLKEYETTVKIYNELQTTRDTVFVPEKNQENESSVSDGQSKKGKVLILCDQSGEGFGQKLECSFSDYIVETIKLQTHKNIIRGIETFTTECTLNDFILITVEPNNKSDIHPVFKKIYTELGIKGTNVVFTTIPYNRYNCDLIQRVIGLNMELNERLLKMKRNLKPKLIVVKKNNKNSVVLDGVPSSDVHIESYNVSKMKNRDSSFHLEKQVKRTGAIPKIKSKVDQTMIYNKVEKVDITQTRLDKNIFRIYYQNVRGLRTKGESLHEKVSGVDYECIALTETWLWGESEKHFPDNFQVFRQDRDYRNLRVTRGGGVLLAINSSFRSSIVKQSSKAGVDELWCLVHLGQKEIIIGCIYIPPRAHFVCYSTICKSIEQLKTLYLGAKFIIAGDFNLPEICWNFDNDCMIPCNQRSNSSKRLVQTMANLKLNQYNDILNANSRILDLIYLDKFKHHQISKCDFPLVNIDLHHPPVEVKLHVS